MSTTEIKKLAVLTSGGDSPAMNAAVYSFVLAAHHKGVQVYAAVDGYRGIVNDNYKLIDPREFKKNVYLSGTAIGSSRCLEFKQPEVRKASVEKFKAQGFDGLFVIGGDGSYMGAKLIGDLGCPVVTAPGTIDNDVSSTHYTIGYFSALEEIFQGVKKIKSTSESHSQVTFVEVMGRHCHDLTVAASVAGAVDYVLTNNNIGEVKDIDALASIIKDMIDAGKKGIVILVTEKVLGEENGYGWPSLSKLCPELEKRVGRQVRSNVLGYIQRGAFPTSWDLYVASGFGMKAFELASQGKWGFAIGFNGSEFYETPLVEATSMNKKSSGELIKFVNLSYKI